MFTYAGIFSIICVQRKRPGFFLCFFLRRLWFRETTNSSVLPIRTHLRILVMSADVLHSWAIPSLGLKVDVCPGRLNRVPVYILRNGLSGELWSAWIYAHCCRQYDTYVFHWLPSLFTSFFFEKTGNVEPLCRSETEWRELKSWRQAFRPYPLADLYCPGSKLFRVRILIVIQIPEKIINFLVSTNPRKVMEYTNPIKSIVRTYYIILHRQVSYFWNMRPPEKANRQYTLQKGRAERTLSGQSFFLKVW